MAEAKARESLKLKPISAGAERGPRSRVCSLLIPHRQHQKFFANIQFLVPQAQILDPHRFLKSSVHYFIGNTAVCKIDLRC